MKYLGIIWLMTAVLEAVILYVADIGLGRGIGYFLLLNVGPLFAGIQYLARKRDFDNDETGSAPFGG